MGRKKFSILDRIRSFRFAINGLKIFFLTEHNGRIHLVAALLAIFLGIFLKISNVEWVIVCLIIGAVFVAEILNTAIEKLADLVTEEINPKIKIVKDIAAGAVLVIAIVALIVGLLVFLPKLIALLL
ncbi:diacylglycerol kinase family protein [Pedobacter changchengzhani]|uniref:Diacylglycerol kinase family protein n=1 Tax=Pedobacter changchengzhani TaxID=2529274 RepID=A0A4R5MKT0_9SPHI|nr:diacylglycerol kinase family protein [Pedobacter changchengzhani]TDG35699.1 diacylglycerol kinase family protein [Pedobacter changchengzhani]